MKKFADAQRITYTMLADPTGAINEQLGIRDSNYPVGSNAFGVPQPGIFVLDVRSSDPLPGWLAPVTVDSPSPCGIAHCL